MADVFDKSHSHILRDIDALREGLTKSGSTPSDWFIERFERNPQNGQLYRHFEMTRNGATLLVMGFTGRKALAFKVASNRCWLPLVLPG